MTIYWLIEAHNNFDPAHTQRSIECTNDWDALWTTHTHIHTGIYQTTANNNLTKTDNNTLFNSTVCAVRTIIFDHIYLFNAWNCIFTMWIFIIYFYYSVIWNNNYIVCKICVRFVWSVGWKVRWNGWYNVCCWFVGRPPEKRREMMLSLMGFPAYSRLYGMSVHHQSSHIACMLALLVKCIRSDSIWRIFTSS